MHNTAFIWSSKKQPLISLSICETEYVTAFLCICHAYWLRNLIKKNLHFDQEKPIVIYIGKKLGYCTLKNPVYHEKDKHITLAIISFGGK